MLARAQVLWYKKVEQLLHCFQGDVWAESSVLGFLWHYYACMEGKVYDITEWASCQVSRCLSMGLASDSKMSAKWFLLNRVNNV